MALDLMNLSSASRCARGHSKQRIVQTVRHVSGLQRQRNMVMSETSRLLTNVDIGRCMHIGDAGQMSETSR